MAENKIKYGLRNVYYAVATIGTNGTATYSTPVALPGAVSLSLSPEGETTPFYADNIKYYVSVSNNGYSGDLELARIPDAFKKDILSYITDGKGVLVENAEAEPVHFALLFQFEGDQKATKHVMYNCTAARPDTNGTTKEDAIDPQTETISVDIGSIYNATLAKNVVKAECVDGTDATVYSTWTSTVYITTTTAT